LEDVFAGIMPFLFLDILTLGLLIAFPQIVLALPNLMF
jgi:TRAP-type mannitol/chloroaromatic compound transport system permease large subunit